MATIKFLVRSKAKGTLATLYLRLRSGRNLDETVPTELKIYPEYWNNKLQKLRQTIVNDGTFSGQEKRDFESKLRKLKTDILNKINDNEEVSLQRWVNSYHNPDKDANLNQYIDRYIEDSETGKRLTDKKTRYTKASIKSFRAFKTQFDLFQGESNKQLDFNGITLDFYDDFILFFTNKGYSPNTIGKYIKHLKTFMRASRDLGLHNNTEIDRRRFRAPSVEVTNIYLDEKELQAMYELNLSAKPNFALARDVFLVGCYTAQRYSDYSIINAKSIRTLSDGTKVIELIQQKTKELVVIPIKPELNSILKKHNYNLPKTYEQKVNKYIKEVGKKAKINEIIQTETIKGGLIVKAEVAKHDLIKTHTARRSGCTNMYLAGISTLDIMKVSGHKSEGEFLKYIKVSKEQTAINLANHPYFMGTPLKVAK